MALVTLVLGSSVFRQLLRDIVIYAVLLLGNVINKAVQYRKCSTNKCNILNAKNYKKIANWILLKILIKMIKRTSKTNKF